MRRFSWFLLLLVPATLWAQSTPDAASKSPVRFEFKDRPTLRLGKHVKLELESKFQFDFSNYIPNLKTPPKTDDPFNINRARFGVVGSVTKHIEFELEREFRGNFGESVPSRPWKDITVDFKVAKLVGVKVGKFKIPFGMEQNTSAAKLDFVNRAGVSDFLTSGRDKGVMVYGKLLKGDRLNYEAGRFQEDGEGSDSNGLKTSHEAWAGRIGGEPLRLISQLPKTLHKVHLGAAAETSQAIEGENGIHGQTASGHTYFPHISVNGNRLRLGAELNWQDGPFTIKSEFINVRQERRKQSIRGLDLSDMFARGWYASGTVNVLGDMKSSGNEPKHAFLTGGGPGVVQLAARFDVLRFDSTDTTTRESRSPRAANILGNSNRVWTLGVNWYVDRFIKFQLNGIHETIEDIQRTPIAGRSKYWTVLARIQVAL